MGQRAAIYCRVSTADQSCARQERDLTAFAARAGYEVVGVYKETGSGVRRDRLERKWVMALAQARAIDVVLVTELSRWGRGSADASRICRCHGGVANSGTLGPGPVPDCRGRRCGAESRVSLETPAASDPRAKRSGLSSDARAAVPMPVEVRLKK